MKLFSRLFEKQPDPRDAVKPLYRSAIDEARRPFWYAEGGVTDSVTGRFDMVTLVTALVSLRLEKSEALSTENALLTECFVEDMDGQLREFGVNDVVVGKRMGKLVSTLGGRMGALRDALAQDHAALSEVVSRNVTLNAQSNAQAVASGLAEFADRLDRTSDNDLRKGEIAQ